MSLPLSAFLGAWAVVLMNVLSPGPNVLNTMTTAMGSGRAAGMASAFAVAPGIAAWALAMSLGMAAVFRAVPATKVGLTLIAASLLLYFAIRYMRAAFAAPEQKSSALSGQSGLGISASFLRSLSINATNPKALTTWIAILAIFPTADAGLGDIILLAAVAGALGFGVHAIYAVLFSTAPAARTYLRAAPVINGAVAIFFTAFAMKLVVPLVNSVL